MSYELFEGESENGDVPEALNAAIQKANENMSSFPFIWRLDSVWGNSTGYVKVSLVAVSTATTSAMLPSD